MENTPFFPIACAYRDLFEAAKESNHKVFVRSAAMVEPASLIRSCGYLNWILSQTHDHGAASSEEHRHAQSTLAEIAALAAEMVDHQTVPDTLQHAGIIRIEE